MLQGSAVVEVSRNEAYALGGEMCGGSGVSDQCAYLKSLFQQALAQAGTNESSSAGDGDQAALDDQAEATLWRTSAVAEASVSMSLPLIKSSRALARDNLPEEVRGREWMGTSST